MPFQNQDARVLWRNPGGEWPGLLVCEHASNFIPEEYGALGLSSSAVESHIAWDPGALGVAERLALLLDAELLAAKFSRLLYDCNRAPDRRDAVTARSEIFDIPGNQDIPESERESRIELFYEPFASAVTQAVSVRQALVTIHSFTPVYGGEVRDVEIGIIHDTDARIAESLLEKLQRNTALNVMRNEPYGPQDGVTHTLRQHGVAKRKPNVMIEIRNDLIASEVQQIEMAEILAPALKEAVADVLAPNGNAAVAL